MPKKKPHFIIKNNFQKRSYSYRDILKPEILQDVCRKVTRRTEYDTPSFTDSTNLGRLAKIEYDGKIIYVSFSQEGEIEGRNYFFQSFPTALTQYHNEKNPKKRICFYFLSSVGNITTDYHMFMYRLMATAGVKFLNSKEELGQSITPFNSVEDIIVHKDKLKGRNKSNNSTFITRNSNNITEIYAKTYGANKYESVLLCLATSRLVDKAIVYEILEQKLKKLPGPSRKVIKSLGNIEVIQKDQTMERKEFEDNDNLTYGFTANLGNKLGAKKCAFCEMDIPRSIEGAHIWSRSDIKKESGLTWKQKKTSATDRDNGIWLCNNHHKLFDAHHIRISENGELKILSSLDKKIIKSIKKLTTIIKIAKEIVSKKFVEYLKKRNRLLPEKNYVSL